MKRLAKHAAVFSTPFIGALFLVVSLWGCGVASSIETPVCTDAGDSGFAPRDSDGIPRDTDTQRETEPLQPDTAGADSDTDEAPHAHEVTVSYARAAGVQLMAIDAYQAFRIPLMDDGVALAQDNHFVAGKHTLFRLYAAPLVDVAAGVDIDVAAQATVHIPGGETRIFVGHASSLRDVAAGTLDELASTLNVVVAGDAVHPDMGVAIEVVDVSAPLTDTDADTDTDTAAKPVNAGALWPVDAPHSLYVERALGPLRIKVLPVAYHTDQDVLLPDVDEVALKNLRRRLVGMFPAPDIQIEMGESMPWQERIPPLDPVAIQNLLNAVLELRQQQKPDKDVYYVALFKPAKHYNTHCKNSCYAGLSWVVSDVDMHQMRASVVLGYLNDPENGDYIIDTILHELGHALGREHSPAGNADNVDPDFPYELGDIGVQGYDVVRDVLFAPDTTYDIMGYQLPQWISDYTWNAIFERICATHRVTGLAVRGALPSQTQASPQMWQTVDVGANDWFAHGPPMWFDKAPVGSEAFPVWFFNAHGDVLATGSATVVPLSVSGGGKVFYQLPAHLIPSDVHRLRFESAYLGRVDIPAFATQLP
ncbi:MAG: hypothetical protein M0R76_10520 [Proteobacteria bacterium]|nr:hypothetical protein [Pseudomonadota bacterium]